MLIPSDYILDLKKLNNTTNLWQNFCVSMGEGRLLKIFQHLKQSILSAKPPAIIGHLDGLKGNFVTGWARDQSSEPRSLLVDVFVNGYFFAQACADNYRRDLQVAGQDDGRFGFTAIAASPAMIDNLAVAKLDAVTVGRQRVFLQGSSNVSIKLSIASFSDYLRCSFQKGYYHPGKLAAGHAVRNSKRRDLLNARQARDNEVAKGRATSEYLDHVRVKWDLQTQFDPTVSLAEYESFVSHYLTSYSHARRPLKTPISRQELEFLNDCPNPEKPGETRAMRIARAHLIGAGEPAISDEDEHDFRWAAYHSFSLNGEDCLVTADQRKRLQAIALQCRRYPISRFMEKYKTKNYFVDMLDLSDEIGRRNLYLYFALISATCPHFLRYVPATEFKHYIGDLTARSPFQDDLDAHQFAIDRQQWTLIIESAGFSLSDFDFFHGTSDGARLHNSPQILPKRKFDVQLFGPFKKSLGISNSCQLLGTTLSDLGVKVNLCDYNIDYPNLDREGGSLALGIPSAAHINMLHLNLEEIPSAFAYLPVIDDDSYVVAFPYTEVTPVTPVQHLGTRLIDEAWCASKFIQQVLQGHCLTSYVGNAMRPMSRLGPDAARRIAYSGLIEDGTFVFITIADALSGLHRKNLMGTIRAFLNAFNDQDNVALVVKLHSTDRMGSETDRLELLRIRSCVAEAANIHLIDEFVSDIMQTALIEGADCLVSLHRSEGLGYNILEAMMLKTAVVSTDYSGSADFCSDKTSFLVESAMVPILAGQYPRADGRQQWANPKYASAIAALQLAYRDNDGRRERIKAATRFVEENFSQAAFSDRIGERLTAILSGI